MYSVLRPLTPARRSLSSRSSVISSLALRQQLAGPDRRRCRDHAAEQEVVRHRHGLLDAGWSPSRGCAWTVMRLSLATMILPPCRGDVEARDLAAQALGHDLELRMPFLAKWKVSNSKKVARICSCVMPIA
jgi:hypothetical protein